MSAELSTRYNPLELEDKWYAYWESKNYFHSEPDERESFSIVIPPPNVTGILHMGHMLNNTIQDIFIRKARLEGKNACWVPGTDHASIATEAKVVKFLREQGIKKSDLTREEFLKYAWQWTDKYGGIILQQLKKLGASCDWQRTAFTLDEVRSEAVLKAFVDLYNKGKLYRDYRMVNWDCEALTVLSNEEVIYNEESANLYHIKYKLVGAKTKGIVIATQRPETIFADVAIAVNPKDPRYAKMIGKKVLVPLIHRKIPIIADDSVEIDFGTGALKITPAHSAIDYEIGKKNNLSVIDTLTESGTLNAQCEFAPLIGKDRFEARASMKKFLLDADALIKIEEYKTNLGRSERTNSVVEPRLSLQWFVDMKQLAEPALRAVETDDINFFPKQFKTTYRHWMENIRDWCISRQLWWGHRIPAYYYNDNVFVDTTLENALVKAREKFPNIKPEDLRQDEDVLDTWFSSWLWPISVFDGFKNQKEIDYYYPTQVLVTGWDIIFLWVARMAMAGFEWKNEKPFKSVYFTGMVRDKQRRKMSKSLGNSPDALKLIDDFGADGVRFGLLSCSPAGGDLLFDEKLCEQGRNFCNKLWNALRLINSWEVDKTLTTPSENILAINWLKAEMTAVIQELESDFEQYRLSEALITLYNLIWDNFCSWYLEIIKPNYGAPIDLATVENAKNILCEFMVLLHPFMPFITEEIWHQAGGVERFGTDCCAAKYPKSNQLSTVSNQPKEALIANGSKQIADFADLKDIVSKVRDIRNQKGLKMRDALPLKVVRTKKTQQLFAIEGAQNLVMRLAALDSIEFIETDVKNAAQFIVGTDKYFIILTENFDVAGEIGKINKEIEHQRGFLRGVESKLNNEKFVAGAPPQVLANERKKQSDALARIATLEESLKSLV